MTGTVIALQHTMYASTTVQWEIFTRGKILPILPVSSSSEVLTGENFVS